MVNSWIQRVVVLLLTILLVLSAFLIWTNFNYNAQLRETVIRENANTATVWSNSVESSLNNLYEHVYDLLLTIYNNTELGRGTPMMRIEVQQRVLDMMGDKLIASSRASCFFVQDGDDLFLFTAKSGIPNREASALKAFARGVAEEDADPLNDKIWTVAVMDGKPILSRSSFWANIWWGLPAGSAITTFSRICPFWARKYPVCWKKTVRCITAAARTGPRI